MGHEVVIYRGYRYRRYPESKRPHLRKYYHCTAPRNRGFLHRHVFEDNHGPIPEGHDVHHVDHNPDNNEPVNLALREQGEHVGHHNRADKPRMAKQIALMQERAKEWHQGEEGRAWHREMAKATWEKRERYVLRCEACGAEYEARFPTRSRFCSRRCKQRKRC